MSFLQIGNQLLGLSAGNVKASLASEDEFFGMPLTFDLNPKSVSMTKKSETESKRGVVKSSLQDRIKGTSNLRLELKEAYLTGIGRTSLSISQLMTWATPIIVPEDDFGTFGISKVLSNVKNAATGFAMDAVSNTLAGRSTGLPSESVTKMFSPQLGNADVVDYRLPILRFMWGIGAPLHNATVNLESVTIDYQRFDFSGSPVFAKINLTLVEVSLPLKATNPTSGGAPGRTRHVLSQGENIIQVANRAYGSPNAWRMVAQANGIDDPLRVRPGRALALPPAAEAARAVTS